MSHTHDHGGGHDHAHHHAPVVSMANRRALMVGVALNLALVIAQVIGGIAFSSLALLSDAVHNAADVGAFLIALFAAWLAARPPSGKRTYGFARAELLAALANSTALVAICAVIIFQAITMLASPGSVHATGMIAVAAMAVVVNGIVAVIVAKADTSNVNIRSALAHALADAAASGGVIIAGLVVLATGFQRADPIVSIVIAIATIAGSWHLVRHSLDDLLDAVPRGVTMDEIVDAILADEQVIEVHDLHVWSVGPGRSAMSAHVRIAPGSKTRDAISRLKHLLHVQFGIEHSTLQVSTDRSSEPLDAVDRLPVPEAIEWATDHIARTHPHLSRSVIAAATGAAAVGARPDDRISPVTVSIRALEMLGRD